MSNAKDQALEVWGELGCFSNPMTKVERHSYPVITPSAARGIFDAIYVKPREFRWQIDRIEVLAPPRYIALRRNEVKDKLPVNKAVQWMRGKAEPEPLWADGDRELLGTDARGRTQRQTMALCGLRYRIHAHVVPWPGFEPKLAAFEAQFRRRAGRGQCFFQPYLGCREFPAYFELLPPGADGDRPPIAWDQDLGLMLYDVFDLSRPGDTHSRPFITLFRARVEGGVVEVPPFESPAVIKPEVGHA